MASAQKPTGARRRTTSRAKKPATIDLKATEVKAEADNTKSAPASSKPAAKTETPAKKFGRKAVQSGTKAENTAKTDAVKKETSSTATKPTPKQEPKKNEKAATPPPSQRIGIRGGLIGGILGSITTVAGLGVIGQMDSAPNFPLIGSLYEKDESGTDLGVLTTRLDALETSGSVNLDPIKDRITKLETAPATDLTFVETDIASLKEAVSSISNAVSSGGEASTAEVTAALAAITSRLDAVEKNANAIPATNIADVDTALAKIAELETSITNLSQSQAVDLTPLESTLAEVQSSVSALAKSVESNAQDVAALNEQSTTLKDTVASVKQSEKVARSVAVNALGTALENDDPVGLALASVKSLVGETLETERLGVLAESGIPTQKVLIAQLDTFTKSIQNPEADVTTGSLSDRFWGSMQNLVTFRSSGPLEGESTIAILSRVKANLEQGDYSALLLEWQKLPQDVQASGESFKSDVSKRMEAFSIYNKLNSLLTEAAG